MARYRLSVQARTDLREGFITLIVLASLTNAVVLLRVLHMRRILDNG